VFNDTRVVRARLFARKDSGGAVELLLERVLGPDHRAMFQARASKALREGMRLQLEGGGQAVVGPRCDDMIELARISHTRHDPSAGCG
jgi:S-adenosylmethionine:tRNA ribosyltransferase-isomerase